ncbi:MAG: multicopper oxidase domain-containing protein [Chromatiaceae bacterium]
MQESISNRIRCGKALRLGLTFLTSGVALLALPVNAQTTTPATGIACTSGSSPNPTFTLEAKPGYIQLPDGNTMYMWGYANGGGAFQHPGPVLCVNQGDTVTVILNNTLSEAVSIMFPGQEDVLANGAPAQPQGDGAGLTSLTNVAPAGSSVTYGFKASNPGTYIYESGTSPAKQVRMGLFGALVVRPTAGAGFMNNQVNSPNSSQFTTDVAFYNGGPLVNEEYMVLLSEIDPYQHWAAEGGGAFDLKDYQPRYWLINGRGFPDSIADNFSPYLPDQPYGALARIHPFDASSHPYPGAIRYLNVGTEEFPFHPHGNNGQVIGRDGRALEGPGGQDLSFEKFAINLGPGQTWDVLFQWYDAEHYDETTNPVPVTIPQVNNQEFGMFYSGSPYLGVEGTLPPGASTLNECGEYYIISHNHALYQITSWGVNLTGPITYLRVDPPLPNNCPPPPSL